MKAEGDNGDVEARLELARGQARVDLSGPAGDYLVEIYAASGIEGMTVNGCEVPAARTQEGCLAARHKLGD